MATVSEVYANLTRSGGSVGAAPTAAPQAEPDTSFIQYASARHTDRKREQDALVDLILRGPQELDGGSSSVRLSGSLFSSEMLRVLSEARSDKKS